MAEKTRKNEAKKSSRSIIRATLLPVIVFVVFSLGFLPIVVVGNILLHFIKFNEPGHILLLPFIISIGIVFLLVSQLLISGCIISLFNIKYEPGTYRYSFEEKNAFNWMIVCLLYTPCRKLIEIVPVGKLKNVYYRLLGMKIGTNTLVGGVIKDPCVTEFGDNVTMGEYAIIYGHIHNYEKRTITINKVIVENNCVIGAGAIIMPGAILQEKVTLAAGALVTKNLRLEKGKKYGGVPAKEIKPKNTK